MLWENGLLVCTSGTLPQHTGNYGYYDAVEDYYTHEIRKGIDFRNNTETVTDKNVVYSTNLFTEAVQQVIEKHDSDEGPFFIYAAYQSVHAPLKAPQKYIAQ